MPHLALVVAVVKDEVKRKDEQMQILIAERVREKVGNVILELPSALANADEAMEDTAGRALLETGFGAEKLIYLSEGASQPHSSDQIASFFLAINVHGKEGKHPSFILHRVPVIHIGPWVFQKGLMVAPTVWAGIYLRISFLLSNPQHGSIQ
jgi:hypothetical protein